MSTEHVVREVRIGMLGAGIIAGIHLPNLCQLPGVRIAAICDSDESRARPVAQQYEAPAYLDARQLLDEAELDALFICLPPFARGDVVERAVQRGLHLYIEKPVALDLQSALRLAEAIESAGVIAGVGYMWRYAPVVERAKSALVPGSDSLLLARMLNGPPGPGWAFDRKRSGGLIVEFATHMADLLRYLGGEVSEVSGAGTEVMPGPPARGPDSAVLALRFNSGAAGSLATSWAFPGTLWDLRAIAPTTHLQLSLNPERLQMDVGGERIDITSEAPTGAQPRGFSGGPSWYLAVKAFVDAARNGDPALVRSPYRDAVRTLALTLACDEAVHTGRSIAVPEV